MSKSNIFCPTFVYTTFVETNYICCVNYLTGILSGLETAQKTGASAVNAANAATGGGGLAGAMPYVNAAGDILQGAMMPKIDYGNVQTMEDAQAIAQQAKQRASGIGKGVGSAAGAAIGSVLLPGIGTAIGGALGGALGGAAGGMFGGNRQAERAEQIAKDREAKMNAIIQSRKDRASEFALASGNTIFQSF